MESKSHDFDAIIDTFVSQSFRMAACHLKLQQTCDYRWFPRLSKFDTVQLTRLRERLARNLQLLYGNGEKWGVKAD